MQVQKPKRGARRRRGSRKSSAPGDPVFAAIDLGTNNCRLLIARRSRDDALAVIDSFSRVVRLGEGVAQTGVLSPEAIDRAVAALKVCAERLRRYRVSHIRAIATEAGRSASNAHVLIERARAETGIALDIVTADEEARLAAIGCAPLIGRRYQGALVFDIGGGSTELIWMRRENGTAEMVFSLSVKAGVVMLSETLGVNRSYKEFLAAVRPRFVDALKLMQQKGAFDPAANHLLGTSGTVTTLAGIALDLPRYERRRVDASWHDCAKIDAIVQRLAGLDRAGRAAVPCVGEERADLVLPGCAIFTAIRELWPCAELRVADRGLRDGMLRELMAKAANSR